MNCHTDEGGDGVSSDDLSPDEKNKKTSSNNINNNNSNHKNDNTMNKSSPNRASSSKSNNNPVDFLYKMKRDPNKRRVKPVERLQFDLQDEMWEDTSSDDEDYKPKKGTNGGDDDDDEDDDDEDDTQGTSQASASGEDDDDDDQDASSDSDVSDGENSSEQADTKKVKRDTEDDSQESQEIPMPILTSIKKISSHKVTNRQGSSCLSSNNDTSKASSTPIDHQDKLLKFLICSVCLGDYSSDSDEIVECDSCGITVHENCYGIVVEDSDNASIHSNVSSASTEPWFCDACKAGVSSPSCELCPSETGIFKRTDTKQWVHVVCALYTSGVTFSDTLRLSGITLLELPYDRWGSKSCSLCEDSRLAKTGISIACDAGMCRTYFHVTCAQRHGLLQDVADLEQETEIVDPFYAHCKLHTTDKAKTKRKKRNYLTLQARCKIISKGLSILTTRTAKKLEKARGNFQLAYDSSTKPAVNITDKIPRALISSPASVKMLIKKADLLGYGSVSPFDPLEIRRKWHIPPDFSLEFVAYFLDRAHRIKSMEEKLVHLKSQECELKEKESNAMRKCNETMPTYEKLKKQSSENREKARNVWDKLTRICQLPVSVMPDILRVCSSKEHSSANRARPSSYLAHRMDNHHVKGSKSSQPSTLPHLPPLTYHQSCQSSSTKGNHTNSLPSNSPCKSPVKARLSLHECGLCKSLKDQHLLALCDSCNLHFHLYCLDPPLTRMPRKTKFGGWQCSDCTEREDELYSAAGQELEIPSNGVEDGDNSSSRKRMRKEPIKFMPDAGASINSYARKRKRAADRMRSRRAQLKKN